ncbi:hypothetical protein [Sphingomonas psychrotolerans]|uniref:DUF4148 domain-containing protein n=1 Tax=Sphingomonas psychrotolerans TaxID=1327635 RepID=A0A2K8MQR3_9SPHN|nr:hypothetical protein [Sphingomonas psychrotolerans]ATY33811.1 hypothetical protein CVN68_19140 [Sphingomonas psychrotolerans]
MSKIMVIAAAVSGLVITTSAFAQDRGEPSSSQSAGFGGRNGSATNLRDTPRRDDAIKREIRSSGVVEPRQTREPASRSQATNNMKQLSLGNH